MNAHLNEFSDSCVHKTFPPAVAYRSSLDAMLCTAVQIFVGSLPTVFECSRISATIRRGSPGLEIQSSTRALSRATPQALQVVSASRVPGTLIPANGLTMR